MEEAFIKQKFHIFDTGIEKLYNEVIL